MQKSKPIWSPFEHQLKHNLAHALDVESSLFRKRILVAVSGGCDSLATLLAISRLKAWHQCEISVLHIHHGTHDNATYRNQASEWVQNVCSRLAVPFVLVQNQDASLKTETQLRDFRKTTYQEQLHKQLASWVLTGHHQNDLLETRLLRLIRGTGPQGLQAMRIAEGFMLRPMLEFSRFELESYLRDQNIAWLEDPTNQVADNMRNWLRLQWLPALEQKQPGGVAALSRSLELILESTTENQQNLPEELFSEDCINRSCFQTLSVVQQKRTLAQYIMSRGARDFRHTQVEEIRKKLDSSSIEHTFSLAGCDWTVNAKQIVASPSRS